MLYIGTSGWHYNDWRELFYPKKITGYNELRYYSKFFNTVENNSSFYRTAKESTYKTWNKMTPENFKFSLKLNRLITHYNRLDTNEEVKERINFILTSTQVLKYKLGAIVIQLPASFKYDLEKLKDFLKFFGTEINKTVYKLDVAIEFRNKYWFNENVYKVLKENNVALVYGQSSRYPGERKITADFAYIRMHGPEKLFASKYRDDQLRELTNYIKRITRKTKRVYVYFNNDYYGYALDNAKTLTGMLHA